MMYHLQRLTFRGIVQDKEGTEQPVELFGPFFVFMSTMRGQALLRG